MGTRRVAKTHLNPEQTKISFETREKPKSHLNPEKYQISIKPGEMPKLPSESG